MDRRLGERGGSLFSRRRERITRRDRIADLRGPKSVPQFALFIDVDKGPVVRVSSDRFIAPDPD